MSSERGTRKQANAEVARNRNQMRNMNRASAYTALNVMAAAGMLGAGGAAARELYRRILGEEEELPRHEVNIDIFDPLSKNRTKVSNFQKIRERMSNALGDAVNKVDSSIRNYYPDDPQSTTFYSPLAIGGAGLGVLGGYTAADKLIEWLKRKEVEHGVSKAQREFEEALTQQYEKGRAKNASEGEQEPTFDDVCSQMYKFASEKMAVTRFDQAMDYIKDQAGGAWDSLKDSPAGYLGNRAVGIGTTGALGLWALVHALTKKKLTAADPEAKELELLKQHERLRSAEVAPPITLNMNAPAKPGLLSSILDRDQIDEAEEGEDYGYSKAANVGMPVSPSMKKLEGIAQNASPEVQQQLKDKLMTAGAGAAQDARFGATTADKLTDGPFMEGAVQGAAGAAGAAGKDIPIVGDLFFA